ncbi:hypothetical protein B4914_12700 [Yersinia entomophaga]|nr:hypothetical protein B4914_12700 [Yersinia entomophaga]
MAVAQLGGSGIETIEAKHSNQGRRCPISSADIIAGQHTMSAKTIRQALLYRVLSSIGVNWQHSAADSGVYHGKVILNQCAICFAGKVWAGDPKPWLRAFMI